MAQTQQPDPTKNAIGLIDAFTRDFAAFISGLVGVTGAVRPEEPLGRRVTRWFMIPDGAPYTFEVTQDCFLLAVGSGYTQYQITVTSDGSTQTNLVSGSFRELHECVGAVGIADQINGNMRTFIAAGTKLTTTVNTGPMIVGFLFELPA